MSCYHDDLTFKIFTKCQILYDKALISFTNLESFTNDAGSQGRRYPWAMTLVNVWRCVNSEAFVTLKLATFNCF